MFQDTCKMMLHTLVPIVVAWRTGNGKVHWGIGAGMIVNKEGFVLTAGHILKEILSLDKQIGVRPRKPIPRKRRVTAYCSVFGVTKARLAKVSLSQEADIGIGKLEGGDLSQYSFPRFRSREVLQGEMLCRVGYPFVEDVGPGWTLSLIHI